MKKTKSRIKSIFSRISKTRKSQMEMFGIAIVVVLLALGMLFAVRFVLLKPQENIKQSFTQKEIAQNFIEVLVKTNAPGCNNVDFMELFYDCANYNNIQCNDNGIVDSCDFLKTKIQLIFANTLEEWKTPYKFEVKKDNMRFKDFYFNYSECIESKRGYQPVSLFPGTLDIILDVC